MTWSYYPCPKCGATDRVCEVDGGCRRGGTTDIDGILNDARARGEAAASRPVRYIDNATYRRHKSALTRAENSGDPEKVQRTVIATIREWNAAGYAWPDDWSRWQSALDDSLPWNARVLVEDIR